MSAPDFMDEFNEWLGNSADRVHTQEDLMDFLELARTQSWDIPSALATICEHIDKEYPMHRDTKDYPSNVEYFVYWPEIDKHFKEAHNWDLTDKQINWSFDT